MSATIRFLAIAFGAASAAMLNLASGVAWYWAAAAGLAVLVLLPICHDFIARLRRRTRLKQIVKDKRDGDGAT